MAARGPKRDNGVRKGCTLRFLGAPVKFKFFDPSIPSMRKCCDGEKKKVKVENNTENKGPLSSCKSTT